MTISYLAVLIFSIGRMLFLAPTLDNVYPLFAQVTTPGFFLVITLGTYVQDIEVVV